MATPNASQLLSVPSDATLTRSVTPVRRSWTKTSSDSFVSSLTRLEALLWKATMRPSAETARVPKREGPTLPKGPLLPSAPSDATLTRSVTPVRRSWANTSQRSLLSSGTRFEAKLKKATKRPSAEMATSPA